MLSHATITAFPSPPSLRIGVEHPPTISRTITVAWKNFSRYFMVPVRGFLAVFQHAFHFISGAQLIYAAPQFHLYALPLALRDATYDVIWGSAMSGCDEKDSYRPIFLPIHLSQQCCVGGGRLGSNGA